MNANKLKPINGSILVVDEKKETKTKSGIFIPANASDSNTVAGEVVAVSSSKLENGVIVEPEVEIGDTVMYSFTAGAGNSFEEEGKMYRIIRPVELLAILD